MPYVPGIPAKIALTTIGVALPSFIYVISNAVVSEITPAAQRGALLAIGTAIATSAGLLAPYVMGSAVEKAATPLDGFNTGFDLRRHHAGRRRHRDGADTPRARGDAVGGRVAASGGRVCLKQA